jgi:ubiquinone/menaquinone biosynthesis C-methylase UbiE
MAELHSAQWLADANRDFYWNRDQLQLVADRLGLRTISTMLDVGCGQGHWTFLLGSVLPTDVEVRGVDQEPKWVRSARARAEELELTDRFRFDAGDVMKLGLPDATFDLVTCQTLLMHLDDPLAALRELFRVTKPGGTILCAEPNSLSAYVMLSSTNVDEPVDELLDLYRFGLLCGRGKAALGEGNDSIGNLLPGYLAGLGAVDVQSFACDKTHTLHPPYASEEQQVLRDYYLSGAEHMLWPRATAKRYFLAGGGTEPEFDTAWERRERECARDADAILQNRFHISGGWMLYLIAGRRPAVG